MSSRVWLGLATLLILLAGANTAAANLSGPQPDNGTAIKWSQPPVATHPTNLYYGWNEMSVVGSPQIVADDFVCVGTESINKVRWWGSYLGWNQVNPPAEQPATFSISIWTDVPANVDLPFSHPGVCTWQTNLATYTQKAIGWDFDPIAHEYETTYLYEAALPSEFVQPGGNNILWISIAAVYLNGSPNNPWGWKMRPRDAASAAPDDAVVIWEPTMPTPGVAYVAGSPLFFPNPEDSWDAAFELIHVPGGTVQKWSQPPQWNEQNGMFFGWDEFSVFTSSQIVADDWVCVDNSPVTAVEWWGSYLNWMEPAPPANGPVAFHLGFWTDVPQSPTNPFSHPAKLVWDVVVPREATQEHFVGFDFYPGPPYPIQESTFLYNAPLTPDQWFHQAGGPTIYWLSVSAIYATSPPCRCNGDLNGDGFINGADLSIFMSCMGMPPVGACRPADLNCDGVINAADMNILTCQMQFGWPAPQCCPGTSNNYAWGWKTRPRVDSAAPDDAVRIFDPTAPARGATYVAGQKIEQPVGMSWDTAFNLYTTDTGPEVVKWSQPPQAYDPPDGYTGWNLISEYGGSQIAADDWACLTNQPVTGIKFWGSFLNWQHWGMPDGLPSSFHLAIWTDVPLGADPFSHPGTVIWQYYCHDYTVQPVGWDFDPRDPNVPPESLYEFVCDLPDFGQFLQAGSVGIYWISIAAVYETGETNYPFGVKTRPRSVSTAPDDAVVILLPRAPTLGSVYQQGAPLFWPTPAESWDLAFELLTQPLPGRPQSPKWTQWPQFLSDGFDLESDLWMPNPAGGLIKWLLIPNPAYPGLHDVTPQQLADDWRCEGGRVTDIHWWGNYENEITGAGIQSFQVVIHADAAGMPGTSLLTLTIPLAQASETFTGQYNSEGDRIFEYSTLITPPFVQVTGSNYWLDITCIPNSATNPPKWRWQEHNRSSLPTLNPAMTKSVGANWAPILWPGLQFTDLAFEITSDVASVEINRLAADDFISDGRDIQAVEWWGSYFDGRYAPDAPSDGVHELDGWLISYHWADVNRDPNYPPDLARGDASPTVLGVYFAPRDAVTYLGAAGVDCVGRVIYAYQIDLSSSCLVCSESDPRNGVAPAQPNVFQEKRGYRYWMSIQAVTGAEWRPPGCERVYTGHLPPLDSTANGSFWGWHTGIEPPTLPPVALDEARVGKITTLGSYPPKCWDATNWVMQPWLCPLIPVQPVNAAFVLWASNCPEDLDGNGVVDLSDLAIELAVYGKCLGQAGYLTSADLDNDGCVTLSDLSMLLSAYGKICPTR